VSLTQLFCRHSTVRIHRSHQAVLKPEDRDRIAWIDEWAVANLIRCNKCGKTLRVQRAYGRIFGEPKDPQ